MEQLKSSSRLKRPAISSHIVSSSAAKATDPWFSLSTWWIDVRSSLLPVLVLLLLALSGCKAKSPGKLETRTMTFVKHHVFIGNKNQKNPLPNNADTLADGKEAFSHYCVACHGNDGQNTGVPFVEHISPPIFLLVFFVVL